MSDAASALAGPGAAARGVGSAQTGADRLEGRAILLAAEDNLVKGASGQAVQNLNLMAGFPETAGLEQAPLFP